MTDEEIMEKLSMLPTFYIILKLLTALKHLAWMGLNLYLIFWLKLFSLGTTDSVNVADQNNTLLCLLIIMCQLVSCVFEMVSILGSNMSSQRAKSKSP